MAMTVSFSYRAGTSYARGVTIDLLLSDEDRDVLYERWKDAWAAPIVFQGGVTGITCDMVYSVPTEQLVEVYGKRRAERLMKAASQYKEV